MLPATARMTRRADFETAVRRGRRAGRSRLVAHAVLGPPTSGAADGASASASGRRPVVDGCSAVTVGPALVGFVVGKVVGGSVVRHRVQRRLRHVVRDRLSTLPDGTLLVVRALPPAAGASSADLAADLDSALRRLGVSTVDSTAATGPVPVDNSASPVDGSR